MSAYIVEPKTISRVATEIRRVLLQQGKNTASHYYPVLSKLVHRDTVQALGSALWRMNARAVAQRYNEPEEVPAGPISGGTFTSHAQAYKSVSCLLYQCSEGGVPDTKLYKELVKFHNAQAHSIACRGFDYDKAEWA